MTTTDNVPTVPNHDSLPRWCAHVEIQDLDNALLAFRADAPEMVSALPPMRATVLTLDFQHIAFTFSAFGETAEAALEDIQSVLGALRLPNAPMTVALTSPEQLLATRDGGFPLVVGVKEVSTITGYTKQRISQLARDFGSDFPRPVATVGASPIWLHDDVSEWVQRNPDGVEQRQRRRRLQWPTSPVLDTQNR